MSVSARSRPTPPAPAAPSWPFVARGQQLDELVTTLLGGDVDIVHLIGPSGVGKTRLASAVLRWAEREAAFAEEPEPSAQSSQSTTQQAGESEAPRKAAGEGQGARRRDEGAGIGGAVPVDGHVPPPVDVVGHGRGRQGELAPLRHVAGVATAAGEDDGTRREVHRRLTVLDEDLQAVIALLKGKDLPVALQFTNYR